MVLPALLSACYARGGYVYAVYDAPPPPQYEQVVVRPGYVWIGGHWGWRDRWLWEPGYYEVARPGYVYVGGTWVVHGNGHHWVPGYWRQQNPGTVVVPSQRPQGRWKPGPVGPYKVHDYRR